MDNEWLTLYCQVVQGRQVKIERYSEGGYRATTVQLEDYPGNLEEIDGARLIFPPSEAGSKITWEDEELLPLCNYFLSQGFSDTDVQQIYETCRAKSP